METPNLVCSDDQFENGIDTHNAVAYVLCHGGSPEVAEKFEAYCRQQADPATAQLNEYGHGVLDYLFEICDIQNEEIVQQIGKILA